MPSLEDIIKTAPGLTEEQRKSLLASAQIIDKPAPVPEKIVERIVSKPTLKPRGNLPFREFLKQRQAQLRAEKLGK